MSSMDEPPRIKDASEVPAGPRFVYHLAGLSDIEAILSSGLDPTCHRSDHSHIADFLETVAENEGITERPTSRQNCVFAYVDRETALHVADNLMAEILLVLSVPRISAPMYVSDCALFTSCKHSGDSLPCSWNAAQTMYERGKTPDHMAELLDDAQKYWASVDKISSGSELTSYVSGLRKPEVMVDGGVPPNAITAIYRGR